jgi:hypothetical protein
MTIAVHEPSNSLIVTAPEQLFKEVERLAKQIDARNEQAVEIIVPTNMSAVRSLLENGFLGGPKSGSGRPGPSPPVQPNRSGVQPNRSGR